MVEPVIVIEKLRREFPAGDRTLAVLKDLDLTIEAGEMVAIMGASGSGKSTLMNILGCLDRPTTGSYRISGRETRDLEPDELAALRREHFGFIFQRYHLLPELTAVGNVEIPAIYAGAKANRRWERAHALLTRLGMDERTEHKPGQLSGGQQQRVSIARALMNGGDVILADEPTGALDSQSGEEVLRILEELHAEGKTIILVTHDANVAARAERIIELSDGEIIADRRTEKLAPAPQEIDAAAVGGSPAPAPKTGSSGGLSGMIDRSREAFRMALLAMRAHKLRTFLTMLGIIIGVSSVVSMVALGTGSQERVLENISSLGTNTLEVFPGAGFGDVRSGKVKTLTPADADAIARQPYAAAVTPTVSTSATVRYGTVESNAIVSGVGAQYFDVEGSKLVTGRFFDISASDEMAQEVVIDQNTMETLFPPDMNPVGQALLVGTVPVRIVGVIESQSHGFGSSNNLQLYLPFKTVQARFLGSTSLRSITVRVTDDVAPDLAERALTQFLTVRHGGVKDFFILNTDDIRQTITSTAQTLTLLVAAIAVISLVVGGIGVMNIMLVAVSERVNEIGVRMAVGARRSDILQQFLIEAVLVCLIGGILGILLALSFGAAFELAGSSFSFVYSESSIIAAFLISTAIGVIFGYLPARNASRLDPVVALSRD